MKSVALPITISLHERHAAHFADRAPVRGISDRCEKTLAALFDDLGLPIAPAVALNCAQTGACELALTLGARELECPAEMFEQAWRCAGGERFAALPNPFAWPESGASATEAPAAVLLAHLVRAAVARRAHRLADDALARAWLARAKAAAPEAARALRGLTPARFSRIAAPLLSMGISLRDGAALIGTIPSNASAEPEEIAERLIAQRRAENVELRAHPEYLGELIESAPVLARRSLRDAAPAEFEFMRDALHRDLGGRIPELDFVPDETLPIGMLAVRINDMAHLPRHGLRAGEMFLGKAPGDPPEDTGFVSRSISHPIAGGPGTLLSGVSREARGQIQNHDHAALNPLEFAFAELRCGAALLDADLVEAEIAHLHTSSDSLPQFPELVLTALRAFPAWQIARILRRLLDEGVSIRPLRMILERLATLDSTGADAIRANEEIPAELLRAVGGISP